MIKRSASPFCSARHGVKIAINSPVSRCNWSELSLRIPQSSRNSSSTAETRPLPEGVRLTSSKIPHLTWRAMLPECAPRPRCLNEKLMSKNLNLLALLRKSDVKANDRRRIALRSLSQVLRESTHPIFSSSAFRFPLSGYRSSDGKNNSLAYR
jgi:hypothetical protein